jgi:glutamyl-tRNA reductase
LTSFWQKGLLGKTQINKIRNKKGEITTNTKEIQGIIRDYFKNLYSNKLENLEEMNKLLDTYDHPKLNQEDINHLNRSLTHNKIEPAIKSLRRQRSGGSRFKVSPVKKLVRPYFEKPYHKKIGLVEWVQGEGPDFKPQY